MCSDGQEQHRIRETLTHCADLFSNNPQFSLSDSVIATAIERFEGNDSLPCVLPKVILINSFYSTQIYDTLGIARHILKTEADKRLTNGDISLVDDIRRGHGIRTKKTGNGIDFYSFATKYAALHEPTKFPIFDGLVMRLLSTLNKQLNFCSRFTQTDLRNYQRYVSVINALIDFADLESLTYKGLDQGLWVYAKYRYDQSNLLPSELQSICELDFLSKVERARES